MAKKKVLSVQKGVRFPIWMYNAIEEIAKKKGYTFTDVVLDLLRQELNEMGYNMGIGREAGEPVFKKEDIDKIGVAEPLILEDTQAG